MDFGPLRLEAGMIAVRDRGPTMLSRVRAGLQTVLLLLSLLSTPSQGQVVQTPPRFHLTCKVVDAATLEPIEGVEIRSRQLGLQGFTDSNGVLSIPINEPSAYFFEFQKNGYIGSTGVLQVAGPSEVVIRLSPADSPTGPETSLITGRVTEAGSESGLEGVEISISGSERVFVTDPGGLFRIPDLRAGTYQLRFSRLGYEERGVRIDVGETERVNIDVPLASAPIRLSPIDVVVERRDLNLELAGFYERREVELGQFLGPEQLEDRTVSKVTDLFNDLRGIRWVTKEEPGGAAEETIAFNRGQGVVSFQAVRGICYPAVWIDDQLITAGGEEPAVLNLLMTPRDVSAIEVYTGAAQIPSRFSGTGRACGAIVMWRRR